MESKLTDLENKVRTGLGLTYQRLVEFKKQKNSPLVVSKGGKIVRIKLSSEKGEK